MAGTDRLRDRDEPCSAPTAAGLCASAARLRTAARLWTATVLRSAPVSLRPGPLAPSALALVAAQHKLIPGACSTRPEHCRQLRQTLWAAVPACLCRYTIGVLRRSRSMSSCRRAHGACARESVRRLSDQPPGDYLSGIVRAALQIDTAVRERKLAHGVGGATVLRPPATLKARRLRTSPARKAGASRRQLVNHREQVFAGTTIY